MGVAVALAPTFDRFIAFLMRKSGRGKTFATALCVLLVNVIGTLTLMASAVILASAFSGMYPTINYIYQWWCVEHNHDLYFFQKYEISSINCLSEFAGCQIG